MSEEEKQVIEEVQYFITNGIDEARPFPIDDWCEILLSIIEKQQKEIENSVSKDKIREKMQEYYEKASPYDCDTANYKQSQEIGGWNALRKLLEE